MIPGPVWRGIIVMVVLSLAMLRLFGWRVGGLDSAGLNLTMLLLGAGFMLIAGLAVGLVVVALSLLVRLRQRIRRSLARIVVEGTPAPV